MAYDTLRRAAQLGHDFITPRVHLVLADVVAGLTAPNDDIKKAVQQDPGRLMAHLVAHLVGEHNIEADSDDAALASAIGNAGTLALARNVYGLS